MLVTIGTASLLLAGFPETAYLCALTATLWILARLPGCSSKKYFLASSVIGAVAGVFMAAPLLNSFWDLLMTSSALSTHNFSGAFLPIEAVGTFLMPYGLGPIFFANGATASAIWGNTGGFFDILLATLAFAGLWGGRYRPLRVVAAAWIVLGLARSFNVPLLGSLITFLPAMQDVAVYRYAEPTWFFLGTMLTAFAISDLTQDAKLIGARPLPRRWWAAIAFGLGALAGAAYLLWPYNPQLTLPLKQIGLIFAAWEASLIYGIVTLIALSLILFLTPPRIRQRALGTLLIVDTLAMFIVPQLSEPKSYTVDTPALSYITQHALANRSFSFLPIAPNYSASYGFSMIDYNYQPIPTAWAAYVELHLAPSVKAWQGNVYWPATFPPGEATVEYVQNVKYYRAIGVSYILTNSGAPYPTETYTPLTLDSGQSLSVYRTQPSTSSSVDAVDILIGTYGGRTTGWVIAQVCDQQTCTSGRANLAIAHDNTILHIPLKSSIVVTSGGAALVTVTHSGGNGALAIWQSSPASSSTVAAAKRQILSPDIYLAAAVDPRIPVYQDATVAIYQEPGAAPMYSFLGHSCRIKNSEIDSVEVDCPRPSTLVRRELFFAGWTGSTGAATFAARPYKSIFQQYRLPAGTYTVSFSYTPQHNWIAMILCGIGLTTLGATILLMLLPRRKSAAVSERNLDRP